MNEHVKQMAEENPQARYPAGFEDCILGIGRRCGAASVFVMSKSKILRQLMSEGASYEDALDHYEYSLEGSCTGPHTPVYLDDT